MKIPTTTLERVAIGIASLILSVGLIALLSGFFAGQDQAGVAGTSGPIGQQFRDLGHSHLRAGELRPAYDSDPPTSGAHVPEPVSKAEGPLSNDQLLQALEVGDVVIAYGGEAPPPGLPSLARSVAGRFTPALASAGQAVILDHRTGTVGLIGLAWTRMVHAGSARDTLLQQFAEQWLGHGAPGH